ncbi:DMT family transporter [Oleidesulfovibrio sp.]|uniref:DMT family transporter n=1 Tax=Oleidesulfovibrio sp. TaxID=2909707 RepID=UPI003A8A5CAE
MSSVRAYHWVCLVGAIAFEVAGTTIMKAAQSWEMLYGPQLGIVLMLVLIGLSYYLLSLATTALPVGVAFAFWEGLGLLFITLSSVLLLGEEMTLKRFVALCAVAGGVLLVHHGTSSGDAGDGTAVNSGRC